MRAFMNVRLLSLACITALSIQVLHAYKFDFEQLPEGSSLRKSCSACTPRKIYVRIGKVFSEELGKEYLKNYSCDQLKSYIENYEQRKEWAKGALGASLSSTAQRNELLVFIYHALGLEGDIQEVLGTLIDGKEASDKASAEKSESVRQTLADIANINATIAQDPAVEKILKSNKK